MISPVSFQLLQYMLHTCECTHNSVRILWGKKENAALQFELIRCSVQLDHVQCFFRNHKMKLILVRSSVSWSSVNCTSGFNRIITTNIRKQIDQVRAEINKHLHYPCHFSMLGYIRTLWITIFPLQVSCPRSLPFYCSWDIFFFLIGLLLLVIWQGFLLDWCTQWVLWKRSWKRVQVGKFCMRHWCSEKLVHLAFNCRCLCSSSRVLGN